MCVSMVIVDAINGLSSTQYQAIIETSHVMIDKTPFKFSVNFCKIQGSWFNIKMLS